MSKEKSSLNPLVVWFLENHVAANLVMIFLLVGGYLSITTMTREIFPTIDPKVITVSVPYIGASPDEIEESITEPVEESLIGIEGVKRISSTAIEGMGTITAELEDRADGTEVYNDIRDSIGSIRNFPPRNAENVLITRIKPKNVLTKIAIYGDVPDLTLYEYAQNLEQDLLNLPMVNDVSIRGGRKPEITLEIPARIFEKYNLSHEKLGQIIQQNSQNLPIGRIETRSGDILLRIADKKYYAKEFADIIILSKPDGTQIRLKDIATLREGFDDSHLLTLYNGKPALFLVVNRTAGQDVLRMEKQINDYLEKVKLPKALKLDIQDDNTDSLKDRLNLLSGDAINGIILLFLCLLLFLDLKLAFWVTMGIPIGILGGLMVASFMGMSLNMMSLFALIVVIGIVVDDAIIIGESIFHEQQNPRPDDTKYSAAIRGVKNVIAPSLVGVSTTIIAFVPLLFTTGVFGQILSVVPSIIIVVLLVSLVEAYLILPSHLSENTKWSKGFVKDLQDFVNRKFTYFENNIFMPAVAKAIEYRYATMAFVLCLVMVALLAVQSGKIRTVFFPAVEGNNVSAQLEMPIDTPFEETKKKAIELYNAAERTAKYFRETTNNEKVISNISVQMGGASADAGPGGGGFNKSGNNLAKIDIKLISSDERDFTAVDFEKKWRKEIGNFVGARSLDIQSSLIRGGDDLQIELAHKDSEQLEKAAKYLTKKIATIEGVTTIKDSFEQGKKEYHFKPNAAGYAAGLTPAMVGDILRSRFNGFEVGRVQRGRDEIRVMVRLPKNERDNLELLKKTYIPLPNGGQALLASMVDIHFERGYTQIDRVNGQRIISLLGDIDETIRTTDEVTNAIDKKIMPEAMRMFQGLSYSYEGRARERAEDLSSLKTNTMISVFVIFSMLVMQLRGYAMPFVIIVNIPLGAVGAIYAHWILGHDLSFMSLFGIISLCGIVVNDSVVLVDCYLKLKEDEGMNMKKALELTAQRRFRAVMLTAITNGAGSVPLLLETSVQAQFLIPMAVSLSCGLVFSASLLFFFTPSLICIIDDAKQGIVRVGQRIGKFKYL